MHFTFCRSTNTAAAKVILRLILPHQFGPNACTFLHFLPHFWGRSKNGRFSPFSTIIERPSSSNSGAMTGAVLAEEAQENGGMNERSEVETPPLPPEKVPLNTHALRKPYMNHEEPFLLERNMLPCPFQQFDAWFKNVMEHVDLMYQEVNAFALSTVSQNGRPSCRMLLLKGYSLEGGFIFFTHSISRKGRELAANSSASMLFYWPRVDRQVRIEGRVCVLDECVAEEYWHKRPLATRIGSKLSEQSARIPGREYLMKRQKSLEELYANQGEEAISRPADWLGYSLHPDYFEFWQGQSNRVHDRIIYEPDESAEFGWALSRLAP